MALTRSDIREQLDRRRREVGDLWNLSEEIVLVGAGELIPIPGQADRTYPFRSHSEYFYLTDRERPGGVLAFDPQLGWFDFVAPVSEAELLWSGVEKDEEASLADTLPLTELAAWLEARRGRPLACLGVPVAASDAALETDVRRELNNVRRPKDALELGRMREAIRATGAGFAAVTPLIGPGRTERELQIELEAEFFRNGGDFLAYETIIAGGPNAAVLHFAPTARPFMEGELVLIDAGAEYRGYGCDITRTFPTSGRFTQEQAQLHSVVRAASLAATVLCKPGTQWREVHRTAALVIAEGLVDVGLLRGQPESLVARGTVSLVFPHGVGHMVGLGVRDAGEILEADNAPEPGFPPLRVDLRLSSGYVLTVEPGIYFVPTILNNAERRDLHRDAVDWERVDHMIGLGGIRIEDDVLITDDGCEVLTTDVSVADS
jgi:Xaa-Pro aminopeptidase